MNLSSVTSVYFSATFTTRKVVRTIASAFPEPGKEYDITQQPLDEPVVFNEHDLLIIGMPVYSGRIPALALPSLEKLKGNNTPAVIVCVYGNRDYDDALLELKEVVQANGFKVFAAGAFIAQHSIFPLVASGRPNEQDLAIIRSFAGEVRKRLDEMTIATFLPEINVSGNHPHKIPKKIPLVPTGGFGCDKCGVCVKQCPTQAISADRPKRTDRKKCISCGRCIVVCPKKVRRFRGLIYKFAQKKFTNAYSLPKDPEMEVL